MFVIQSAVSGGEGVKILEIRLYISLGNSVGDGDGPD